MSMGFYYSRHQRNNLPHYGLHRLLHFLSQQNFRENNQINSNWYPKEQRQRNQSAPSITGAGSTNSNSQTQTWTPQTGLVPFLSHSPVAWDLSARLWRSSRGTCALFHRGISLHQRYHPVEEISLLVNSSWRTRGVPHSFYGVCLSHDNASNFMLSGDCCAKTPTVCIFLRNRSRNAGEIRRNIVVSAFTFNSPAAVDLEIAVVIFRIVISFIHTGLLPTNHICPWKTNWDRGICITYFNKGDFKRNTTVQKLDYSTSSISMQWRE